MFKFIAVEPVRLRLRRRTGTYDFGRWCPRCGDAVRGVRCRCGQKIKTGAADAGLEREGKDE